MVHGYSFDFRRRFDGSSCWVRGINEPKIAIFYALFAWGVVDFEEKMNREEFRKLKKMFVFGIFKLND